MQQTAIPFHFFRGGTSRGPYFNSADLPSDRETLAKVLIAVIGAGHALNIDGIGGGVAVTTKVAILSRSESNASDIDYFFAQVDVNRHAVDFRPTCGNILSGVGPAAIEMNLFPATGDETRIRIRSVNNGALVEAVVQTPGGKVEYQGGMAIDGVPGTAAAVSLQFMDVVGANTGAFLPSGQLVDIIDGIPVTCMDVAMPMVIARAADFGLRGDETPQELDGNAAFVARREAIRIEAGRRMGLGDVSGSVVPKFGVLSAPRQGGTATARYFMPQTCHPTMAVTGAQCLAACLLTPGTVADGLIGGDHSGGTETVMLEHPSGTIEVLVDYWIGDGDFHLRSAGLVRTARLLARGEVFVPADIWAGPIPLQQMKKALQQMTFDPVI